MSFRQFIGRQPNRAGLRSNRPIDYHYWLVESRGYLIFVSMRRLFPEGFSRKGESWLFSANGAVSKHFLTMGGDFILR